MSRRKNDGSLDDGDWEGRSEQEHLKRREDGMNIWELWEELSRLRQESPN